MPFVASLSNRSHAEPLAVPLLCQRRFPIWHREQRACENLSLEKGLDGGAERDRTADLLIANEALSQLSYGPAKARAADPAQTLASGAIYGPAFRSVNNAEPGCGCRRSDDPGALLNRKGFSFTQ